MVAGLERSLGRLLDAYEVGAMDVEELRRRTERVRTRLSQAQRDASAAEAALSQTVEPKVSVHRTSVRLVHLSKERLLLRALPEKAFRALAGSRIMEVSASPFFARSTMMDRWGAYQLRQERFVSDEIRILRATAPDGSSIVLKLARQDPCPEALAGRLHHERAVLDSLAHIPGVAKTRGIERRGGQLALVLEDAGNQSLKAVLQERGRLAPLEALTITRRLAEILEAVHMAGVIHKDVKPQNILIDEKLEQVCLLDFGLASRLNFEATAALIPEALEGTLAYISPEQTGRTSRTLDARTDLYSLGVMLFELLTGRLPFVDSDPLALVHAHLAQMPPAIETLLPSLPSSVARIVERLLAKDPASRYHTAHGLMHDLDRCIDQLQRQGRIDPFPIAQKDFSHKLHLPDLLVGREKEVEVIRSAFERATQGNVEILAVGGPSGIGKTALVRSVYREMAHAKRGLLLSGKHDQLARSTPYAALVGAFGGLIQNIAASPRSTIQAWKERIQKYVGANARAIADLIPELEWVTGKLAPLPELPGDQAANRLKLAWLFLVQAVLAECSPLVLFLDDLQWIDPASVELLKVLFTDTERHSTLLIAVYRDNEVDAAHPLWLLLGGIEKSKVKITKQTLCALQVPEVSKWLAVALSSSPERVETLAGTLWNKTRGNPFFIGQLLLEMYRTKKIVRNLDTGEWLWNEREVEQLAVTDNVVDLMQSKLHELPDATLHVLGLSACTGHQFSLDDLKVLSGMSAQQVAQALWPAFEAGMILAMDSTCRYAQALAEENKPLGTLKARYKFLHDRVQQACYERISSPDRNRAHLDIGRRLRRQYEVHGGTAQELLDLVRHLNLGADQINSRDEIHALAKLNREAALKAKASGVYRLMSDLILQGLSLLGPNLWEAAPELSAQLSVDRVDSVYLLREFDKVEELAIPLLERPLSALTRWMLQDLRIRACLNSGMFVPGIELGKAIFAEEGLKFPPTEQETLSAALTKLKDFRVYLDRLGKSGLNAMPLDTDPLRTIKDTAAFSWIFCIAVAGSPAATAWALLWRLQELAEKGSKSLATAELMALVANVWGPLFDELRECAEWAFDSLELLNGLDPLVGSYARLMAAAVGPYRQPARDLLPIFEETIHTGITLGHFPLVSAGCFCSIRDSLLWSGAPLPVVLGEIEKKMLFIQRAGDIIGQRLLELIRAYMSCLLPDVPPIADAAGEYLSMGSSALRAQSDMPNAAVADILETHLFLILQQPARAFERACQAHQNRAAMNCVAMGTDAPLYLALAACALMEDKDPTERESLQAHLEYAIKHFRYLSAGCEENFLHKLFMLEAEQARLAGQREQAEAKYDAAIDNAHKQGHLYIEALAATLCGEFHRKAGRRRFARLYLEAARDAYERWGARAIVRFMDGHYSDYLDESVGSLKTVAAPAPTSAAPERSHTLTNTTRSTRSEGSGSLQLQVEAAVRAAQTLSGELDPERIVAQLMRLVIASAGAQRGALLLGAEESLNVIARLDTPKSQIETNMCIPLSKFGDAAQGIIETVAHTRQPLVLPDAPGDPRFAQEPRFGRSDTHSVLAVPLVHQTRLLGVLYLEHNERNAFNTDSVNLVGVLASQTAISLENARLYEALRRSNVELESQVMARTAELQDTLKELWSEMDLATKIQTVLLPADGTYGGHEFAATMRPADKVGGDYYDIFEHAGATWILVGDVSGHGVSAGLIMMMVQSAVRTLVCATPGEIKSPADILTQVNAGIAGNLKKIGKGQYMTIVAMCLFGRQARVAGLHLDLLVYRAAMGAVQHVELDGIWLGITEDAAGMLQDQSLTLDAGDIVLFHTDGLPEARKDGEWLGLSETEARLKEKGIAAATPREIVDSIFAALSGAQCPDDVTVAALRVK